MDRIELFERATVSQGAHLCAGTHDISDRHFQLQTRPIEIHRDAWVAAGAFIGPGVVVGEACVVGARAVVLKATEDFGVYVGNPAVKVKTRVFR